MRWNHLRLLCFICSLLLSAFILPTHNAVIGELFLVVESVVARFVSKTVFVVLETKISLIRRWLSIEHFSIKIIINHYELWLPRSFLESSEVLGIVEWRLFFWNENESVRLICLFVLELSIVGSNCSINKILRQSRHIRYYDGIRISVDLWDWITCNINWMVINYGSKQAIAKHIQCLS